MRLLIDEQNLPGKIVEFCKAVSEQANIPSKVIRTREKDIYKINSRDFDEEIREVYGFETFKEILDDLKPDDILITNDIELATQALPKVTTIIDSDGQIINLERLNLLTIKEYLARSQGRMDTLAKPLRHYDDSVSEEFGRTLFHFLGTV